MYLIDPSRHMILPYGDTVLSKKDFLLFVKRAAHLPHLMGEGWKHKLSIRTMHACICT